MNKNKLDSMLKTIDTFKHEPIYIGNCSLVDIATMLRQQQAEIADKKLVNDTFADLIKRARKKNRRATS